MCKLQNYVISLTCQMCIHSQSLCNQICKKPPVKPPPICVQATDVSAMPSSEYNISI